MAPAGSGASLHVTIGVETDTDELTWFALLAEVGGALRLPDAAERLQAAQWQDERLREALPLAWCRPGGSLDDAPQGPEWLARARTLLREHLSARPAADRLHRALGAALLKRQALIEGKRRQLLQFMDMAPRGEEGGGR